MHENLVEKSYFEEQKALSSLAYQQSRWVKSNFNRIDTDYTYYIRHESSTSNIFNRSFLSEKSHLSTRDLFFDQERFICMIINQHRIFMRASNFHLNVKQILSARTSHKIKKTRLLAKFKNRDVKNKHLKHDDDTWISFTDDVFLCQAVELEKNLKSLFSHSSLSYSNRDENYLLSREKRSCLNRIKYVIMSHEDHFIAYWSIERTVNVSHLLRLRNISRNKLMIIFKTNSKINKNIRSRHASVSENYIFFENALIFCKFFKISLESMRDLIIKNNLTSNDKISCNEKSSV